MKKLFLITFLCAVEGLASGGSLYFPGFTWSRYSDWTERPLSDQGTTHGNPDDDSLGNPVWSYEWVYGGGGLGSVAPWYQQPGSKLIWDADWYGHGYSAWARADDAGNKVSQDYSPMITRDYLLQNLAYATPISSPDQLPVVRWSNPASETLQLRIAGSLRVVWGGWTGGWPTDVDVILGKRTAAGLFETLFASTLQKPHNDHSHDLLDVLVDVSTSVEPSDELSCLFEAMRNKMTIGSPWRTGSVLRLCPNRLLEGCCFWDYLPLASSQDAARYEA